jgi:hypothetical protein
MIENTMVDRLEKRAHDIIKVFNDTGKNWEETVYRILSRNFGFSVNKENMYLLAKLLPLSVLSRYRGSIFQMEALLFGVAGFLERSRDSYSDNLKCEFEFLSKKHTLNTRFLQRYQWKFLRLRPQNFPTIRIAQLASLLGKADKLFSIIVEFNSIKNITEFLKVKQSVYWEKHYDFGKTCNMKLSGLGLTSIRNILSNTFVPILSAYSKHINSEYYLAKAVKVLEVVPAESNHIIHEWIKQGIKPNNSFESQGLIELSNSYCYKKKCLNCSIGADVLLN